MKISALFLMFLLLMVPLAAKAPTANDITVAVAALTDATICAVAAFINTPALELPGMQFHYAETESLPRLLVFDQADLGTFLPYFLQTRNSSNSFFASLLRTARGPLNDIAIQYLTVHAWQVGHAILQGSATTEWRKGDSVATLMGSVLSTGAIPPLSVDANVLVSGRRVSTPVKIDGTFLLYTDEEGYFAVEPISLKINGKAAEGQEP
jgi:hypothetical protein